MHFWIGGFVLAGIVVGAVTAWALRRDRARESAALPVAGGSPEDGTAEDAPFADVSQESAAARVERREHYYVALRHQALHRSRAELGLPKPSEATKPWGVLMESTHEDAFVTVLALSDGSASIYLSTGGGFIGGIGQESIRHAATRMVRVATGFVAGMTPTADYPLPDRGRTRFYVRTDAGVLTADAPDAELAQRRHALAPLFFAGQDVITAYRVLSEKNEKK
jgi:hypothetical protein